MHDRQYAKEEHVYHKKMEVLAEEMDECTF